MNPRNLPINGLDKTVGQMCVYDLGFCNQKGGYEKVTLPFLTKFQSRIRMWVDHHDHERWKDWRDKSNFRLVGRRIAPSCPFLVSLGEFENVPIHIMDKDFDALATGIRACGGGYSEMVWDSVWAECRHTITFRGRTVTGFSPTGRLIEDALKAHWNPEEGGNQIRRAVFDWLVYDDMHAMRRVQEAARDYESVLAETERYLKLMKRVDSDIAVVDLRTEDTFQKFDLTELLLRMRETARFAVVAQRNRKGEFITVATHDEGVNLVQILGVEGGFGRRVTVEHLTVEEVVTRLHSVL